MITHRDCQRMMIDLMHQYDFDHQTLSYFLSLQQLYNKSNYNMQGVEHLLPILLLLNQKQKKNQHHQNQLHPQNLLHFLLMQELYNQMQHHKLEQDYYYNDYQILLLLQKKMLKIDLHFYLNHQSLLRYPLLQSLHNQQHYSIHQEMHCFYHHQEEHKQ